MSDKIRDMIMMRLDGMTYTEIAERQGVSKQYVEQSIRRALGMAQSAHYMRTVRMCVYPAIAKKLDYYQMTTFDLADKTGLGAQTVRNVISGKPGQYYTMKAIADALELTMDEAYKR